VVGVGVNVLVRVGVAVNVLVTVMVGVFVGLTVLVGVGEALGCSDSKLTFGDNLPCNKNPLCNT
jgi:hypothetical protein